MLSSRVAGRVHWQAFAPPVHHNPRLFRSQTKISVEHKELQPLTGQSWKPTSYQGSGGPKRLRATTLIAAAAGGIAASMTSAGAAHGWDEDHIKTLERASLVVVTIPACPYCKRAKEALAQGGYPYEELDASKDAGLREAVKTVSGSRTVPQVFVGGASIGGSDSLAAALSDGTWAPRYNAALSTATPALPTTLITVLREAAARVTAAAVSGSGSDASYTTAREQLAPLAHVLAAEPAKGGVPRAPTQVGARTLRTFTGKQLLGWLDARDAGSSGGSSGSSKGSSAQQRADALLRANFVTAATADSPYPPVPLGTTAPPNAAAVAQAVADRTAVAADRQYALVSEAPPPVKGQELNTQFWWSGPVRPASEVASELRGLILALYDAHLAPDGRSVSYSAMRTDPLFGRYVHAAAELQRVDISPLPRDELMALFLNLYNALIIHAMVVLGPPTTTVARASFFSKDAAYCIGGRRYTADDMENGVLRGNRSAASNLFNLIGLHGLAGGVWKADDPRTAKVVTPLDPRLHFALVCGAKSCPPIKLYTPDNLEEGLAAAGEAFCAGEVVVDKANASVALSMIFKWYAPDFGRDNRERLQYVLPFLQGSQKADLQELLASGRNIKVTYRTYDWGLNE